MRGSQKPDLLAAGVEKWLILEEILDKRNSELDFPPPVHALTLWEMCCDSSESCTDVGCASPVPLRLWIVFVLSTAELEGYNQGKWRVRMSKTRVWMNKIRVLYEQYSGSGTQHPTKHQLIWRVRSLLQRLKVSNNSAQGASALPKEGTNARAFRNVNQILPPEPHSSCFV